MPVSIEKVSHENLGDKVYRIIKNKILQREVLPGDRLNITELAQALDVSRSLVRNALTLLANDGLVDFFRRGIFVKRISRKEMQDIYELRKLIESFSLKKGLAAMSDQAIRNIKRQYEQAARDLKKGNLQTCFQLDVDLHQLLVDSSQNSHLIKMFSTCQALMKLVILSDFEHTFNVEQSLAEHKEIIDSLERRDLASAEQVLLSHFENSEKRILNYFPD